MRKPVSDYGPFKPWLVAHRVRAFPTSFRDLLAYFDVRKQEKAAWTVYTPLVAALKFLETSGEVPKDERISEHLALEGAVKEAVAGRARWQELAGATPSRKQAPPVLLVIVVAFELTVLHTGLPVCIRAHA